MTAHQSVVDNYLPPEDICGFDRPRDPYRIKNRRYLRQISRVETFKNWPQQLSQTPEELADAGFVYKNISDVVKCISCKLRLSGWQPEDDPLEEHVKCNSSCEYLKHHKGEKFIEELSKKLQQNPIEAADVQQPDANLDAPVGVCKVCSQDKSNVMFIPCGHLVTCTNCASAIKKCFYCSHRVDRYQKVYL
ncbi:baculoviral IAP repeat-containing protein 3-like [Lutzomyia longipalpis]|uniref:baculoviral IAP repeat-containing protein 3-like n=1 Tax=Lutzomyia longipalpis TaxID=7200 RepID=UPI002483814F|nr:baculoviral IAP repeat-containing protein 3-like [Lutzomyia longipalpis]